MEQAGRPEIKVLSQSQRLVLSQGFITIPAMPDRIICESSEHSTPNNFQLETRSPEPGL